MGHTGGDGENEWWPLPRFPFDRLRTCFAASAVTPSESRWPLRMTGTRRFRAYEGLNVEEFRPYVEQALPAK